MDEGPALGITQKRVIRVLKFSDTGAVPDTHQVLERHQTFSGLKFRAQEHQPLRVDTAERIHRDVFCQSFREPGAPVNAAGIDPEKVEELVAGDLKLKEDETLPKDVPIKKKKKVMFVFVLFVCLFFLVSLLKQQGKLM